MWTQTLVTVLPFLAGLAGAVPLVHERDYCDVYGGSGSGTGVIINKIITTEIVYFPILIDTYVNQNTVLKYVGGYSIYVDNAPTQIRTIATGTSTATNTAVTTVLPGNVNIFQTINIINFPVVISTFIQQNTIIQSAGGINIVINNAPTFLLTTATATSTVTATVTSTVTTGNTAPTSFLLVPVAAGGARRVRRQAAQQFIAPNGDIVDQCSEGAVFSINNGQLTSNGQFVSTNTGADSALFQTAQAIGDISTTFTFTDRLTWSNAAFDGGVARFCSTGSSTYALFTADAAVDGCVPQSLIAVPAASCVNNGTSSSSSASSTQSSTSLSSVSSTASVTSSASSSTDASTTEASSSSSTDGPSSTSSGSSSSAEPTESSSSSSAEATSSATDVGVSTTTATGTSSSSSAEPTTSSSSSSSEAAEPTTSSSSEAAEPTTSSSSSEAAEPTTSSSSEAAEPTTSSSSSEAAEPTTSSSSEAAEPTTSSSTSLPVETPAITTSSSTTLVIATSTSTFIPVETL